MNNFPDNCKIKKTTVSVETGYLFINFHISLILFISVKTFEPEQIYTKSYDFCCKQVDVIKVAYHQEESIVVEDKESIHPRDVGHNIYILAHQVSHHPDDEDRYQTSKLISFIIIHTVSVCCK